MALTALLPLFKENANSAVMNAHSMKLVKDATNALNLSQIPIICADQPLFALAKVIQWTQK